MSPNGGRSSAPAAKTVDGANVAMTLSSMTGFARCEGAHENRRWVWEIKSVNGRGLEMRFRLPPGLDFVEPALRKTVAEFFSRGSFNSFLSLKEEAGAARYAVNQPMLDETLRLIEDIKLRTDCDKPRPEGILNVRGVIELDERDDGEAARAALAEALVKSFRETAAALQGARSSEGAAMAKILAGQLVEIERLTNKARQNESASLGAIRDRINAQLAELIESGAIPEERIAQEAAMFAVKADIREELDRLDAHVAAGRDLLKKEKAVGRRLDFLTQEFNREANTLCSKAQDMTLKQTGLELKTVIDQMREQVQNIE